jgi:hypothetical protein
LHRIVRVKFLRDQRSLWIVTTTKTLSSHWREIADEMQSADELRERLIESHQTQIEVDEPEDDSMALLMGGEADKPAEDDMSEEKLLRALMAAQGQG